MILIEVFYFNSLIATVAIAQKEALIASISQSCLPFKMLNIVVVESISRYIGVTSYRDIIAIRQLPDYARLDSLAFNDDLQIDNSAGSRYSLYYSNRLTVIRAQRVVSLLRISNDNNLASTNANSYANFVYVLEVLQLYVIVVYLLL